MLVANATTPVHEYSNAIQIALDQAREAKPSGTIDPALTPQNNQRSIEIIQVAATACDTTFQDARKDYAAIETACRNIFYRFLSSTQIGTPAFGEVWNLLDIVSTLSDRELCEPGLIFWLVEELLDSQTIDGCRIVFDYLDSRRDNLTAKHFKEKSLIILRTCNELLRRLSRAEDTVFCGRVFIFLFQSFPLGDKSSVNLRGEFHVENVTSFEALSPKEGVQAPEAMDVDQEEVQAKVDVPAREGEKMAKDLPETISQTAISSSKVVKFDANEGEQEVLHIDMDNLYSDFWSLQEFFSQPTKLFEATNLEIFKRGLHATMLKFKEVQKALQPRGPSKPTDEGRRSMKRKRAGHEDELSSAFNPKYLTSRDLFDLEISDLAFRRHIMVQSLIIIDFLLSLNPRSKKKLEHLNNRAVQYGYTISEENTKWATDARADISLYLMQGPEGKFYYRMVDTVLSRDKNWTHWKVESCPPIEKPSIPAKDFREAMNGAQRTCANKRLKSTPLGTLDLKFLNETGGEDGMKKLGDPKRYSIPTAESFERAIADDQFAIEMGASPEEKQLAEAARASKLWRTLRVASRSKLGVFDKIDDGKNLETLFRPEAEEDNQQMEMNGEEGKETAEDGPGAEGDQINARVAVDDAPAAPSAIAEGLNHDTPAIGDGQTSSEKQARQDPIQDLVAKEKEEYSLRASAHEVEQARVIV